MFIAIGPNCWGKGTTQEAAVKVCRKHAPRKCSVYYQTFRCIVFTTNDDTAQVNDFGGIVTNIPGATVEEVARLPKSYWAGASR